MGMGRGYGLPPKILSLMAMPASSASMTPVVIMRTAVCIAVRRTSRMQSTRDRRSRDLRSLVDCIRLVRRTAMQTAVRMITTGVMLALLAGIAIKLKIFGGSP